MYMMHPVSVMQRRLNQRLASPYLVLSIIHTVSIGRWNVESLNAEPNHFPFLPKTAALGACISMVMERSEDRWSCLIRVSDDTAKREMTRTPLQSPVVSRIGLPRSSLDVKLCCFSGFSAICKLAAMTRHPGDRARKHHPQQSARDGQEPGD